YSGEAIYDEAGKSARGGGDVNGDGFSDFIIGAANVDRWDGAYDAGKAYLLMGHAPPWTKWISLGDVQDSFVGERANDYNGYAVSPIGDFNRDGSCDFASSAPYRDAYPVENLGMVYLFFGDKLTNTIQGSAAFWAGAHIPGVKLKVNGDSSGVRDASGEYMLGLRRDRDYMVVPERTSGEADRECAISSYDAAVVARHAVGYESMSQAQCAVADVNGDEFIRFDDAMLIARSAVGIGNGSIGTWVFSPPSRSYPFFNADQLGQNFSGRIMGDVDSSWTSGLPKAGGIRMFFSIDTRPDSVFMTCSVESERPFLSFDLSVRFDEASLRFKSVEQTGLGKGFTVLHALHGGVLAVGGFRTEYASGAGNFVRLSFLPKGSLPPGLPQPVRAQIDGIPISTITTLSAVHKEAAVKPQWTQAFPNPFNQNTACTLRLHEDGLVIAEVYDAGGRRVRTLERGIRLAGVYGISWDGTNDSGAAAASGVYLLRVRTENADLSQKVLYLR
ncbi:MAG TPA: FlgD immunoglobulin-like domain containing protein, partial [bacterium]